MYYSLLKYSIKLGPSEVLQCGYAHTSNTLKVKRAVLNHLKVH